MSISVGLFGGSFNPAHHGHLHLAETAQRHLGLHQIWWMPSPQNPLKPRQPTYDSRVQTIEKLGLPNGMMIRHVERDFGTQYTIDMVRRLTSRQPTTRFVFLMGADNFAQLPRWKDWQAILRAVPIAVISRPGPEALRARLGPAARLYPGARIPESQSHILKDCQPPAWTFITAPLNAESSSRIRAARQARAAVAG